MPRLTIPKPTPAELLLLSRRRRRETIAGAAERHGVTIYRYRAWERGDELDGLPRGLAKVVPEEFEAAYILRRRAGLTIAELADEVGLSAWWLTQIERGEAPAASVVAFWTSPASRPLRRRRAG